MDDVPQERLRLALDLYEAGERLMRQNLRRQHPNASEADVDRLLAAWLRDRPDAPDGDAVGRPAPDRFG